MRFWTLCRVWIIAVLTSDKLETPDISGVKKTKKKTKTPVSQNMTNTKQNAIILKTAVGISEPYGLPYLPLPASPAVTSFHLVHDADFDAILWLCRCNFDEELCSHSCLWCQWYAGWDMGVIILLGWFIYHLFLPIKLFPNVYIWDTFRLDVHLG